MQNGRTENPNAKNAFFFCNLQGKKGSKIKKGFKPFFSRQKKTRISVRKKPKMQKKMRKMQPHSKKCKIVQKYKKKQFFPSFFFLCVIWIPRHAPVRTSILDTGGQTFISEL